MSDVHVRKSKRGRKKSLTDSTRKLHKQDNSAKYNKTRICIGAEYDRHKDVLRIKTHAEVANILRIGRFISRVISSVLVLNY